MNESFSSWDMFHCDKELRMVDDDRERSLRSEERARSVTRDIKTVGRRGEVEGRKL